MKVRFTRPAQRDLAQIHTYISQDSPDIASRFVTRLVEHARALADNPYQGRETDEPNVRVIIAPRLRYLIFYTVTADEIHIDDIRHASHDPIPYASLPPTNEAIVASGAGTIGLR